MKATHPQFLTIDPGCGRAVETPYLDGGRGRAVETPMLYGGNGDPIIWPNKYLAPIIVPPMPQQALYDRKRKFIATLDCQSLFDRLDVLDEEIGAGLTSVEHTALALASARSAMEMAEITACWEVEGKNETERKTRKAAALRDDAEYQASVRQVTELEGQKVEANLRLGNAQRQVRRVEHQIDYRIAVLRYLGE